ncbi:site-specific integrase [Fodinibius saliphilus]|uniref:site-specific integrase n=1 Tax=Fodinibius saliphilus TaxID=1920650 RepID=UPI001107CFD6|nr:site-specific integrase [Fodinibius saliphilus]
MAQSSLLSKMRTEIRRRQYSYFTEQAYIKWVIQFLKYHNMQHPAELDEEDVLRFLIYLAETKQYSLAIQKQALSALLFLYDRILGSPLETLNRPQVYEW